MQLVNPNLSVRDNAGWCLRFTQSVYGTAARHPNAWQAWLATQHKHTGSLPNLSVPVHFSHYATYNGIYDNWGHIVAYVPGRGFLSSPRAGHGQEWFSTTGDVERAFNAKYVGWSEDLNGTQIVDTKGGDVITQNDVHRLRIISSEVKGWNFDEVHSGKTDDREAKAWVGQTWQKFLDQAWTEEGSHNYRVLKGNWRHAHDVRVPEKDKRIKELEKSLAEKPKEIIIEKPVEVEKIVIKEVEVEVIKYVDDNRTPLQLIIDGIKGLFKG